MTRICSRPLLDTSAAGLALLLLALFWPAPAAAQYLRIRDICRVKGQEENTLHGLGLVVGLNGTGDSETTTIRALAKMLELMGNPVAQDARGQWMLDELKNTKNVAMVFVTATVPAEGSRQGDTLNCEVSAISAKSLEGGILMMAPLLGPRPGSPRVYGFAQGILALDQNGPPTVARIRHGCRLEEDFHNAFVQDGKVTLVLDKTHATFQTAFDIEELLNDPQVSGFGNTSENGAANVVAEPIAKAIDQVNIEIRIPEIYARDTVAFVSGVLDIQIVPPRHDARVVIDKRNGVIVVGENVMVGRVAVSHKNIAVQTGKAPTEGPLFVLDQAELTTRLQALVNALNALKVGTDDIISIIENLQESRVLYGRLVVR